MEMDFEWEDYSAEVDRESTLKIANDLVKCRTFIDWYTKFMQVLQIEPSVAEVIEEHIENGTHHEALDWFQSVRHNMNWGHDVLLKELEELEEYELCAKVKETMKRLRHDALELEMKLERRLLL